MSSYLHFDVFGTTASRLALFTPTTKISQKGMVSNIRSEKQKLSEAKKEKFHQPRCQICMEIQCKCMLPFSFCGFDSYHMVTPESFNEESTPSGHENSLF